MGFALFVHFPNLLTCQSTPTPNPPLARPRRTINADALPIIAAMLQTTHVKADLVGGVPVALLTTEKVGEYEAHAIEVDLLGLGQSHRHRYAVDFSQVRILSSVGIGLLIKLTKAATVGKGKVVFFGMDKNLLDLLAITRLDKGMSLSKSQADAVKVLQEV